MRPQKFPAQAPVGPRRKPWQPELKGIDRSGEADPHQRLSTAFRELYEAAELELCDIFDIVDEDGTASSSHTGRGSGTSTKLTTAAPTKGAEFGRLDKRCQSLRWFEIRSSEIASLATKAGRIGVSPQMTAHFDTVAAKMRFASAPLSGLDSAEAQTWTTRATHLGFSSIHGAATAALAKKWASKRGSWSDRRSPRRRFSHTAAGQSGWPSR